MASAFSICLASMNANVPGSYMHSRRMVYRAEFTVGAFRGKYKHHKRHILYTEAIRKVDQITVTAPQRTGHVVGLTKVMFIFTVNFK